MINCNNYTRIGLKYNSKEVKENGKIELKLGSFLPRKMMIKLVSFTAINYGRMLSWGFVKDGETEKDLQLVNGYATLYELLDHMVYTKAIMTYSEIIRDKVIKIYATETVTLSGTAVEFYNLPTTITSEGVDFNIIKPEECILSVKYFDSMDLYGVDQSTMINLPINGRTLSHYDSLSSAKGQIVFFPRIENILRLYMVDSQSDSIAVKKEDLPDNFQFYLEIDVKKYKNSHIK